MSYESAQPETPPADQPATWPRRLTWVWPALTLALLLGAAAERRAARHEPEGVAAYHAAVAAAAEQIDRSAGPWLARPVPVPPAAVKMLRPNAIASLRYEHAATGASANLLFVQVRDTRDLLGHYPPRCYTGLGWSQGHTQKLPIDADAFGWPAWAGDGRRTRYVFTRADAQGVRPERIAIDNLMILPRQGVQPDMDAIDTASRDQRRKFLGAAQLQVVTPGEMTESERDAVVARLFRAVAPAVAAAGASPADLAPPDRAQIDVAGDVAGVAGRLRPEG